MGWQGVLPVGFGRHAFFAGVLFFKMSVLKNKLETPKLLAIRFNTLQGFFFCQKLAFKRI